VTLGVLWTSTLAYQLVMLIWAPHTIIVNTILNFPHQAILIEGTLARWDSQSFGLLEFGRNQLAGDSRRLQMVVPFMGIGAEFWWGRLNA